MFIGAACVSFCLLAVADFKWSRPHETEREKDDRVVTAALPAARSTFTFSQTTAPDPVAGGISG